MKESITSKIRKGVFWTAFFHAIDYILNFGSSIVLARLLFPEDFGLFGLASIAIQFARRVSNFGFTTVLVWLKNIKEEHYDTVFLFNLTIMTIVGLGVYFSASYYADFFNNEKLTLIIRVILVDFILRAFIGVPHAILKRQMKFNLLGIAETIRRLSNIGAAISLAFAGAGVWSLIIGSLVGSFAACISLLVYAYKESGWLPGIKFRIWALKDTFAFGIWIYINTFIGYGIDKVDYFFIGKFLGAAQLGFYERAFRLMSFPRKKIVRVANSVLFSGYSRMQDDDKLLMNTFFGVITHLSIIAYPLMIWFFFAAPSLIPILYGERWTPVVLPLQIMCMGGVLDSLTQAFKPLLRARGFIANDTRRNLMYFILLIIVVALTIRWGIVGVSYGIVFASIINLGLMLQVTTTKLPITMVQFFRAQLSAIVYGSIQIVSLIALTLLVIEKFNTNNIVTLIIISSGAVFSFFAAHFVLRFKDVDKIILDMLNQIKKIAKKIPLIKHKKF